MSDEARAWQAAGDEQRSHDQQRTEQSYEPPRVDDIPADGPAITAAGANNGGVLLNDGNL